VAADELLVRAADAGVSFVRGSDFYVRGQGGEGSARLAFSFVTPDAIREGVSRLARLIAAAPMPARALHA
jgi:DNA-binding transcriptional MocR family regulator